MIGRGVMATRETASVVLGGNPLRRAMRTADTTAAAASARLAPHIGMTEDGRNGRH